MNKEENTNNKIKEKDLKTVNGGSIQTSDIQIRQEDYEKEENK